MKSPILYLVTAFIIAFAVLLLVPVWYILGVGEGEGHVMNDEVMTLDVFNWHLQEQQKKYGQPDGSIKVTTAGEVFILARQFSFTPNVIRLETGKSYTLNFYSADVIHGVSLVMTQGAVGEALSLSSVLPPGPVSMVAITPQLPGEILVICTEYCGLGHHLMESKIVVEGPPYSMKILPWYQRLRMPQLSVDMWMYHDLYYSQYQASNPELFWDPLPAVPGLFMAPHPGWSYWHYEGPPENMKKHLETVPARLSRAPATFQLDWRRPPEESGLYR